VQSFVPLTMAEDLALLTSSGGYIADLVLRTMGDEPSSEYASPHVVIKTLYASAMVLLQTRRCNSQAPPKSLLLPSHAVANPRPTEHAAMAFPWPGLADD